MLQLVDVVDVLDYTVNSALEPFNVNVVVADFSLIFLDQTEHGLLFGSQVVHGETKLGVSDVESTQLVIHIISLIFKFVDFGFSWRDIPLQVLDLVIKNELELF